MRRTRFLIAASAVVAFVMIAPSVASTATDPTRISFPASASLGCSGDGVVASRWLAADTDLSKTWDRKRREAFARLLVAAEHFASVVALHETDHNVTSAGCDIFTAQATERHVFRQTLATLVSDTDQRAPLMSAGEADRALNAAYSEVMAVENPHNLAWGTVEKAGIRKSERAWLAYRQAFVAFAATFETRGVAERLKIELTLRRATSLEAFLAD